MDIKTIIYGKEITTKDQKKFPAFTTTIKGAYFSVKFVQDCEKYPKKAGVYELILKGSDYSIQKGKPYTTKDGNTKTGNPTIWVRSCDYRQLTQEELDAINEERNKSFLDSYLTDEDMPF